MATLATNDELIGSQERGYWTGYARNLTEEIVAQGFCQSDARAAAQLVIRIAQPASETIGPLSCRVLAGLVLQKISNDVSQGKGLSRGAQVLLAIEGLPGLPAKREQYA